MERVTTEERDFRLAIGGGLAMLRTLEQMTQRQLADLLEVDQSEISKWESGKRAWTVWDIQRIEDALGATHGRILAYAGYLPAEVLPLLT